MATLAAETGSSDNSIRALAIQRSAEDREVEAQLIPRICGEWLRQGPSYTHAGLGGHSPQPAAPVLQTFGHLDRFDLACIVELPCFGGLRFEMSAQILDVYSLTANGSIAQA